MPHHTSCLIPSSSTCTPGHPPRRLPQQRRAIVHGHRIHIRLRSRARAPAPSFPPPALLARPVLLLLLLHALTLTLTVLLVEPKDPTLPLQLLHDPTRPLAPGRGPQHSLPHCPPPRMGVHVAILGSLRLGPQRQRAMPVAHALALHMQTQHVIAAAIRAGLPAPMTVSVAVAVPIGATRRGSNLGALAAAHHDALFDQTLDLHAIGDEQQLGEGALLTGLQHARQPVGRRVAEDVPEVAGLAFRPDGDRAAEALQPDLGPVLAERARQEFEVAEHLEPFVQVEFEVLLGGGAEEAAAPAAAAAVRDGAADGAARGEEEEVDVRVDLADDTEVDVEVGIQRLEGDIRSQAPVFPFVAEGVRGQDGGAGVLHHEHDGVEDAGHGGGGEHGGPDDAVGRGEVVDKDGGGVRVRGHAGDVEDAAGALVGFAEGGAAAAKPTALAGPLEGVEARAGAPPAPRPGEEAVLTGADVVG